MKSLELKVPPVLVVAVVAGLMWLTAHYTEAFNQFYVGQRAAAIFLLALGVLLPLLGVIGFRRAQTTVDPRDPAKSTELVTTGIYQRTRNPMYLGFFFLLMSWGVFLGSVFSLWGLALYVAYMNRFQIIPEERILKETFGETYKDYCQKTGRWW
ncbi:MAG TPA: isoprenylcysteine carboxylmethyltransferase family protein [Idiomarina abyssalis]|jgi:protein-S-isoprenylcysteine O-methyltransferase Ste14|uniref:methyltransferase family protein n=1 Tax=Idiomarina TaxID=135575 RepID=UPI000C400ABF|nr:MULTISPECIES: isoprenylcysteine carboxylmethyltransferase family protein [Idiomarina]MBH93385.1 protein-S-isoprenylcysteine methyltransferase [Idiomarina sp.]HAS14478.1 isoprenylcysteine carboxylmethyltransferase family protein [Idiomarina abyssalis]|tara:strand:- start:69 stop:530 length:462 start_codon:yes stop_codon:yes gene_type:complete